MAKSPTHKKRSKSKGSRRGKKRSGSKKSKKRSKSKGSRKGRKKRSASNRKKRSGSKKRRSLTKYQVYMRSALKKAGMKGKSRSARAAIFRKVAQGWSRA